ncbi:MAG: four helix bundle protein [Candidatus Nealsonbacteria bacterium DGGOD1a]|jgi:four helix bundle protein|nr:MAG: four helix bundle protein [Candidatus Nealsonbacteria bacterium DGGOD1a]
MTETNAKHYDLEKRTCEFARRIRSFLKKLPRSISNVEDSKQLARSSGSIGANYIEANEALGKKDFNMHAKISRKEAKESRFWLMLIDSGSDESLQKEREALAKESEELMNIFGAIVRKSE